ncbi:MAG: hypothetical protein V3T72_06760 [Thermoanaerobaculia bacterium]
MGTSGPDPGTTREDLREFVLMYEFPLDQLGKAWGGLSAAGVSQRLAGNPPALSDQVEITLAELGLDFEEFCLGVATRFHPELELHAFIEPARRAVGRFQDRLLKRAPKRRYSPAELAEMVGGLETLRFRDARDARRRAVEILRSGALEPDVAGEAWGVLGVLYRHRGHTAIAAFCLLQALRSGASPTVKARTLQRIAMLLLFNAGKPGQALQAIGRARKIYRLAEDGSGVGKTYVDEAVVHSNCGEHRLARRADRKALRYLDEEDRENFFAALQGLAVAAVFLGDAAEGFRYLEKAAAALADDACSRYLCTTVRWLQGELSLLLGQYGEAAEHFVAVWDALLDLDIGPLEVTLISLRVAKAYWLQGDREGSRQILQDLVSREKAARRSNPLLAPVLSELLRESAEGTATAELLEETYRKLREGTSSGPPLLPSSLPG